MLTLKDVSVRFGRREVLRQVTLDVRQGSVLAIVGENGAGKSTALRVLAGELTPTSGDASLDGLPLRRWSAAEAARRRAVVPQHAHLTFSFQVLDVVLLGRFAHHRGRPGPDDERYARSALRQVGLHGFEERRYTQLSGGERQRVHVARTLAQLSGSSSPRYWLLDEPTASLDIAHRHTVLRLAGRLAHDDAVGVAVVLHDLNLAARYADRVAVMKDGKILQTGPVELLTDASLVETAFGVPVRYASVPGRALPLMFAEPSSAADSNPVNQETTNDL